MPKTVTKMQHRPSRSEQIRGYVEQMQKLLDERNFANVQIRNLHVEIRKELAIPRNDFITAMRLVKLATDKREKTVANVGEVLRAAGTPFRQLKELRAMERLEPDDFTAVAPAATDAELGEALSRINAKLRDGSKIKALIGEFVEPGQSYAMIPAVRRAEFVSRLEAL